MAEDLQGREMLLPSPTEKGCQPCQPAFVSQWVAAVSILPSAAFRRAVKGGHSLTRVHIGIAGEDWTVPSDGPARPGNGALRCPSCQRGQGHPFGAIFESRAESHCLFSRPEGTHSQQEESTSPDCVERCPQWKRLHRAIRNQQVRSSNFVIDSISESGTYASF